MKTPLLVGVDVGGTRTTVITSADDPAAKGVQAAGGALRPGRVLRSAATVAEAVRRALAGTGRHTADVLALGAAGAGLSEERAEFARTLRGEELATTIRVTTDADIALRAAFGLDAGILVAAGTGSIAVARDPAGEFYRAGGYGWQMGDEGSGYYLGRRALEVVGRAQDGRGEATELTALVLQATHCSDFDRLVRWAGAAGPAEIAGLGSIVQGAAEAGDAVAAALVDAAAGELIELAVSLKNRVEDAERVAVALAGGALAPGPLRRAVESGLEEMAGMVVVDQQIEPARGALQWAREIWQALPKG